MSRGEPDVKAIFTAAIELPEGPKRDAYLDAACGGDAGMRRRIEELLAAFARAGDVLGPSGPPTAAIADSATTNADAAPGRSEPPRGADLETTDARTRPTTDRGSITARRRPPASPGSRPRSTTAAQATTAMPWRRARRCATSATTRSNASWAAAAWASSTRPARSRSTDLWR